MTAHPALTGLAHRYIEQSGLGGIRDKVVAAERLTRDDGLTLYRHADLLAVGALANLVRS
jgi:aminodeoxyfutalosine synthase